MTSPVGVDPELARQLELSEMLGYGVACYGAAAELPGNPAGAAMARIGGGAAFALTALDFGFFNRVIGFGMTESVTEAAIEAASSFYLDRGLTQSVIQLAPSVEAQAIGWMEARGYVRGARWVKMWHGLQEIPLVETSLRIEHIGPDRAADFTSVCMKAFEMPPIVAPVTEAVVGRPGWTHYLGFDGDQPVSAAAMYIADRTAWLGFGATLESHRGRGGQSALFAARLRDARDAGCRWAVTETGAETAAEPVNHSYRNMLRTGFTLAYLRQNWVRIPQPG